MEPYRDDLIDAYFTILNTVQMFFHFGMRISLMDELKELDGWIDDGIVLPVDLLDTMKDPLVRKISVVVKQSAAILEVLDNLNAFTDEEIMGELQQRTEETKEKQPVDTRPGLLNELYAYYFTETIEAEFYAAEMCYSNGYACRLDHSFCFDPYSGNYFNDENLEQIAAFCRLTDGLMDYIDHYEPGHQFSEAGK